MTKMYKVSEVKTLPSYRLLLTFKSGEIKIFDMTSYLQYPVMKPLRDELFFAQAQVKHGTVMWPGDIDISPSTLFLESVSATSDQLN